MSGPSTKTTNRIAETTIEMVSRARGPEAEQLEQARGIARRVYGVDPEAADTICDVVEQEHRRRG